MRVLRVLAVTSVFLSAVLAFSVEPLTAKRFLPAFGGTASVWVTCLVAFQGLLLLGYLYAHALTRLPRKAQIGVHLAALAVSFAVFPWRDPAPLPAGTAPLGWLLVELARSSGLPFFVLSTNTTLVQHWYSKRTGEEPWYLYAVSNLGSFVGLLSYPLVIEPMSGLHAQARGWMVGFAVFAAITAANVVLSAAAATDAKPVSAPPPRAQVARWFGRSALGAMLLTAASFWITMDVAALPLLWEAGKQGFLSTYEASFNMNYRTVDPSRGGGTFDINPRGAREINTTLAFNFTDVTDGDTDDGERLESYTASAFQIGYAEYWAVPWMEYQQHTIQFSTQFGYVNRNVQFNGEFFAGGKHPYSSFNQINVNTEFAGYEPFSVTGETMLMTSLAYRMPLYRDFDKKIGPFYFDSLYLQFFGTAGNLWSFRPNPTELEDGSFGIAPLVASGNIRELPLVGLFSEERSNKLENNDTVPGDDQSSYADIPIEGMGKRRYGSSNPDMFARAFPVAYKNGNRLLTDLGAELRVRAYAYNYNPWFSFFRLAYGFQDTTGVGDQNGDRIFRDLPPNDDPVGEIEKAGFRYYIGIGTGW